ncbi:glycosyltransferase family 2 protein [Clostridium butyricum]|uniref:glycosyltransferase family 2 protein n=2 Tax=Clostridium butyricum TaxID=1492 RepID=UPI0021C44B07|nr:glycosyltransferase family 2 protein [Clostridium butyricum]MCQ2015585.1 glycosyltransferase [Clostridium butyricum]
MKILVSVILTVYNKENYIEKCINSIITQTYNNIEIIIVDDGSTDTSYRICKKYEQKDYRIKLFNKSNGGVSSARNFGINQANGDKIIFVDGDDYIDCNYISDFIKYAEYDLVVSGYKKVSEKETCIYKIDDRTYKKNDDIYIDVLKYYMNFFCVPYLKLFDLSNIKKNKICFQESISFGEDTCFVMEYLLYCNNMKLIDSIGYNNIAIGESLSRNSLTEVWETLRDVNDYVENLYKKNNKFNFLNNKLFYLRNVRITLYHLAVNNYKFYREKCEIISKDLKNRGCFNINEIGVKNIFIIYCIKIHLYFIVYLICRRKLKNEHLVN